MHKCSMIVIFIIFLSRKHVFRRTCLEHNYSTSKCVPSVTIHFVHCVCFGVEVDEVVSHHCHHLSRQGSALEADVITNNRDASEKRWKSDQDAW